MHNYFNTNHHTDDSQLIKDLNTFLFNYDLEDLLKPNAQEVWDWLVETPPKEPVNMSDCYAEVLLLNVMEYLISHSHAVPGHFRYGVFGEVEPYWLFTPKTDKGEDDISTYDDMVDLFETLDVLPERKYNRVS